jgi:hypothetical protein
MVYGLGFKVWNMGFSVKDFRVLWHRVLGLVFGVWNLGSGLGLGLGFKICKIIGKQLCNV